MKKIVSILAFSMLLGAGSNSFAIDQSAVFLNNYDANIPVVAVGGGNSSAFFVEVLGGAVGGPLFAIADVFSTDSKFTQDSSGFFDSGGFGFVLGVAAGANGDFQVRAWQGTGGDTFDTAGIRGSSAVWTQATGTVAPDPALPLPAPLLIPGASIQLAVVPEPSIIALGVLGGLGLLLRRRK